MATSGYPFVLSSHAGTAPLNSRFANSVVRMVRPPMTISPPARDAA
jgi:hypothetical protein